MWIPHKPSVKQSLSRNDLNVTVFYLYFCHEELVFKKANYQPTKKLNKQLPKNPKQIKDKTKHQHIPLFHLPSPLNIFSRQQTLEKNRTKKHFNLMLFSKPVVCLGHLLLVLPIVTWCSGYVSQDFSKITCRRPD